MSNYRKKILVRLFSFLLKFKNNLTKIFTLQTVLIIMELFLINSRLFDKVSRILARVFSNTLVFAISQAVSLFIMAC